MSQIWCVRAETRESGASGSECWSCGGLRLVELGLSVNGCVRKIALRRMWLASFLNKKSRAAAGPLFMGLNLGHLRWPEVATASPVLRQTFEASKLPMRPDCNSHTGVTVLFLPSWQISAETQT